MFWVTLWFVLLGVAEGKKRDRVWGDRQMAAEKWGVYVELGSWWHRAGG